MSVKDLWKSIPFPLRFYSLRHQPLIAPRNILIFILLCVIILCLTVLSVGFLYFHSQQTQEIKITTKPLDGYNCSMLSAYSGKSPILVNTNPGFMFESNTHPPSFNWLLSQLTIVYDRINYLYPINCINEYQNECISIINNSTQPNIINDTIHKCIINTDPNIYCCMNHHNYAVNSFITPSNCSYKNNICFGNLTELNYIQNGLTLNPSTDNPFLFYSITSELEYTQNSCKEAIIENVCNNRTLLNQICEPFIAGIPPFSCIKYHYQDIYQSLSTAFAASVMFWSGSLLFFSVLLRVCKCAQIKYNTMRSERVSDYKILDDTLQ